MKVSAVVPTRNRPESLIRTVRALVAQSQALEEILIVDSSDEPLDTRLIPDSRATPVRYLTSPASVCLQRNIGIRAAQGDYVFLCDDDVEPPADYVELLSNYIADSDAVAVTGLCLQKSEDGRWVFEYPVRTFRRLVRYYLFQQSIWGSIDQVRTNWLTRPIAHHIQRRYRMRGNSVTRAGWPVLTQFDGDVIRTRIYALGASIIKKTCFDSNLFDETLDPHGIGDNYGVALNLPEKIHVIRKAFYHHHAATENRLATELATFRRMLALHYFLSIRSNRSARIWLMWSLLGRLLACLMGDRRDARGTARAMSLILTRRNPYLIARASGRKFVAPLI